MPKNKKLTQLQKKLEEWSPGASKIIDIKKMKNANDVALQRKLASKLASSVPNTTLASNMVKSVPETLLNEIAKEIRYSGHNVSELKHLGSRLLAPGNMSAEIYSRKLAETLCDKDCFMAYYNSFPEPVKKCFLNLAFDPYVFLQQIEKAVKSHKRSSYYGVFHDMTDFPLSFAIGYGFREILFVPPNIKARLQEYFAPYQKPNVSEKPDDFSDSKELFSEEAGQELVSNLPQIYQTLSNSDFFERNIGSAILKNFQSQMNKVAKLTEFAQTADFSAITIQKDGYPSSILSYSDKDVKRMQSARTTLALYFISLFMHQGIETKIEKKEFSSLLSHPQDLIKRAVGMFFEKESAKIYYKSDMLKGYVVEFDKKFIYPHMIALYYYDSLIEEQRKEHFKKMFEVIRENPPLQPTIFKDYIKRLVAKGLPPLMPIGYDLDVTCFFEKPSQYRIASNCKERVSIKDNQRYDALVLEPACTNLFLTLASIGLFEITWNPCNAPEDIPDCEVRWLNNLNFFRFGKIGRIRMTDLGKYAFGIIDTLEIKNIKKYSPATLDKGNLTIHVDKDDRPMQIFLTPYCTALSHTFYRIDRIKLKAMCDTKSKVNDFFENIEVQTEGPLPQILEDLKNELLERFVVLKSERNWLVYSLEKMEPAVVREIGKLALKGICVKMEGKRFAVKESDYIKFKTHLELAGFKVV